MMLPVRLPVMTIMAREFRIPVRKGLVVHTAELAQESYSRRTWRSKTARLVMLPDHI